MSASGDNIEAFYSKVSTFPFNLEIGIMQIGHKADFLDDCAYLQLAQTYLKNHPEETLTREHFVEFSNYVNAVTEDGKKRVLHMRSHINQNIEGFEFKDVGDINTVQYPVCVLNRLDPQELL